MVMCQLVCSPRLLKLIETQKEEEEEEEEKKKKKKKKKKNGEPQIYS